mmetsp:Transcript_28348/g.37078  ORF Transcript_28348/g.37078 Transcript_28348/m.37078 type:complete len:519 (+) Transcript_28348:49-1605(+)
MKVPTRALSLLLFLQFSQLIAGNFYVCDSTDSPSQDFHIRGTSLGGWMVLEPWITPSLFYQFLSAVEEHGDAAPDHTAVDQYTFCEVLGAKEANRQLRVHWATWVTEEDIAQLAHHGFNSVRIPVGDWMYKPYAPFEGCVDGALEEMERVLDLCDKYGLKVLIDVHGMKDSQNGFDNSGRSKDVIWTTVENGRSTFSHWDNLSPEWIGTWDNDAQTYTTINYENIEHSLQVLSEIVNLYKDHPAVDALQPVNEPWWNTPIKSLKEYYWFGYQIVQEKAPHWKYIMHDSFRLDSEIWGGFMKNCHNIAIDTHIYQAFGSTRMSQTEYLSDACGQHNAIAAFEAATGIPVVVGEWSLATDTCALWLTGFNENQAGQPLVECDFVECSEPYWGDALPGWPLDKTKGPRGVVGSGTVNTPLFGLCPVDKVFHNEDEFVTKLARAKLHAFDLGGHGWYFWNFKTDLEEPRWDYSRAVERGWFPRTVVELEKDESVTAACGESTTSIKNVAVDGSVFDEEQVTM